MKQYLKLFTGVFFIIFMEISAFGQTGHYDPHKAFNPLYDIQKSTVYRSADGQPGPEYWINRADYTIYAKLDTLNKKVWAQEEISYTNHSPNALSFLWLELGQNRFSSKSKSAAVSGYGLSSTRFNGGFQIETVEIGLIDAYIPANYKIIGTRMQIRLPVSLPAKVGTMKIRILYSFKIPPKGNGRSGWMKTQNGVIYEVAQWFPRMAVYDDLVGWNVLPFLGAGEFYSDYGDYDITIEVPKNQIVASSGKLLNPRDVLEKKFIDRLKKAEKSDKTIRIKSANEFNNVKAINSTSAGKLQWHFKMKNSRDFAWASSNAFIWEAAGAKLPNGTRVLSMALYPKESKWKRAVEFLKGSIELFSKRWFPYPYSTATTVGGPVGGMEYPGIVFCSWRAHGPSLWMVTNHEIGHTWFPMVVGTNERNFAWMDEGMNTFIDIYAAKDFNHGEFAPKQDHEYNPKGGSAARNIVPLLTDSAAPTMMSYADAIPWKYGHQLGYYKSALGLVLLREYILGPDRFDYAFKTYIHRWAYKHPSPFDFFNTMNNAAGEDLNWFWKGWFIKKWKLDQAVQGVKYVKGNAANGSLITILNLDQMVMPVTVKIVQQNGDSGIVKLPVEIWEKGGQFTFYYPSVSPVTKVVLDPNLMLPDVNPVNNIWINTKN